MGEVGGGVVPSPELTDAHHLRTNQTISQNLPHFCAAPQPNAAMEVLSRTLCVTNNKKGSVMNSIIYLVGLVVVVMAVLSFVGLH
ncbi:MAG: hypothetical protein JWR51_3080 [Devosia sp.]|nr:hypothetical protein [Devosia sp.]